MWDVIVVGGAAVLIIAALWALINHGGPNPPDKKWRITEYAEGKVMLQRVVIGEDSWLYTVEDYFDTVEEAIAYVQKYERRHTKLREIEL